VTRPINHNCEPLELVSVAAAVIYTTCLPYDLRHARRYDKSPPSHLAVSHPPTPPTPPSPKPKVSAYVKHLSSPSSMSLYPAALCPILSHSYPQRPHMLIPSSLIDRHIPNPRCHPDRLPPLDLLLLRRGRLKRNHTLHCELRFVAPIVER